MNPLQIKVIHKKELYIKWDDQTESNITLKKLRRFCPCATCAEEREKQSRTFIPLFPENQITLTNIGMVGSYAIQITWKDGHSTGIYEFPYLRQLANN